MTCSIVLLLYDWGEYYIIPFNILPWRGIHIIIDAGIFIAETPGHIQLFAFPSGTRKEEIKKYRKIINDIFDYTHC